MVLRCWRTGDAQAGYQLGPALRAGGRPERLPDAATDPDGPAEGAAPKDPGIVLADNDAGHYIRYYTECSVIANNFLLTRQHEQKIRQIDYLTSLPAAALPGAAPFVRYMLVRPVSIERGDNRQYMSYSQTDAQLLNDLLLRPIEQVPSNYVLIEQANIQETGQAGSVPYIRLFKVNRPVGSAAAGGPRRRAVAETRRPLTIFVANGRAATWSNATCRAAPQRNPFYFK